ncbi:MAG: hypothetical protein GX221_09035 [Candidatus Riflebacteria bacterium]|nr:hypothetical protein [Candidatus Riflebacteria bacterium]
MNRNFRCSKSLIVLIILFFSLSTAYSQNTIPVRLFKEDFIHVKSSATIFGLALEAKGSKPSLSDYDKLIDIFETKSRSGDLSPSESHDYAALLTTKAILTLETAQYDELETMFSRACELLPEDHKVFMLKGDFYLFYENNDKAVNAYIQAAKLNPEYEMAHIKAGITALKTAQYARATESFAFPQQNNAEDFLLAYWHAYARYKNHDFERAQDILEYSLNLLEYSMQRPDDELIDDMRELLSKAKTYVSGDEDASIIKDKKFIISFAGTSEEDIGCMTFEALDDVYYEVTSFLNFDPHMQVRVTFMNREDYAASGAMEWFGAHIDTLHIHVPLTRGYRHPTYAKALLAHEFTHAIIHMKTKGNIPTWLNEGIAQYQEFTVWFGSPDIIRPDYEGLMKHMIENNSLPDLSEAEQMFRSKDGNEATKAYIASYLAIRYIVEKHGEKSLAKICDALGKDMTISEALNRVVGYDFETLNNSYKLWVHAFQ